MPDSELHVVTGALGYSGKYIARRLLESGVAVRTLTNSAHRPNPFGAALDVRPLSFDDPQRLRESLRGGRVLYNTYWVRFNHRNFFHEQAVQNTLRLFQAAKEAGVGRIVHVSITNPTEDSPLEYFSGKARLERALRESGLSYAILRPTVLFGPEDILINNIAWCLRKFPVFPIFGDGAYRLQPIHVDDLAALAVEQGQVAENRIIEAIGPETFSYRELISTLGLILGKPRPMVRVPASLGYLAGRVLGWCLGDVLITQEEIQGLMAGLLYVDCPPTGTTWLTDWARENAAVLGRRYASELARRRPR
ncbi:MAG: NAD(P)H-binding protein [Pirellulales bacterium]|nr:NAD(P)H-binding protein [Pirellulales bacterium]